MVIAPIENSSPSQERDCSRDAVDERPPDVEAERGVRRRLAGDRLRPAQLGQAARRPEVDPQHHVRVEDGHEPVEVAFACGGEERLHDLALRGQVRVGNRARAADAPPRPARELPRRLRRAVDDGGDLVERHAEDVVEDEGQPLRRRQRLEHDEQRQPDRVGDERLVLGVDAVRAVDDRIGEMVGERLLATCDVRDRSTFSETRPTTVVSQPPRFSIAAASVRLSRSHVSWTASSASLSEPSIR